jgi:hypothetical protein
VEKPELQEPLVGQEQAQQDLLAQQVPLAQAPPVQLV